MVWLIRGLFCSSGFCIHAVAFPRLFHSSFARRASEGWGWPALYPQQNTEGWVGYAVSTDGDGDGDAASSRDRKGVPKLREIGRGS